MGSKPLRGGKPRLLGDHSGRRGRLYDRKFKALAQEYALDGELRAWRDDLGAVSVLWVEWVQTTRDLETARRARERGRGRRPSASAIVRLQKRASLAWDTFARAEEALRGRLKGRNAHDLATRLMEVSNAGE